LKETQKTLALIPLHWPTTADGRWTEQTRPTGGLSIDIEAYRTNKDQTRLT